MKEIIALTMAFALGWWAKKTVDENKAVRAENERLKKKINKDAE